ncbi:hypothetical protein GGI04_001755 [Coemansia thaxteri]|uniref:Hydroxysteroid dehydrogenase-like protein 2 n=1 Tax=Coemansia thaxteri TaxID=2663907 RepID=A0A9W8BFW5_9FUNG|nr:hypothetical protein H4R26_003912 [Coemansia thaxteri]KAJ2006782.1 hypothetical protein GGI04_001755 [Coemansia thaxteri]KAJ2471510.1 hypothetical protein GGI02_002223 [Coemansia sp. RSA 2322]KAJ2484558.1 hypothetical protein EV174_002348 [Coemansia sp. RSA 2320]
MRPLSGKTVFITGGTRGIGRAIAIKCAKNGAQVVVAARNAATSTVVAEILAIGGQAIAVPCDIQHEEQAAAAVEAAVERFGGIDVVVNNASTLVLRPTADITMNEYDLMAAINTRGSFAAVKYALPYLRNSANGHILTLCPKPQLDSKWFTRNTAYAVSKFSMGLMAFGLAAEQKPYRVASNALWPYSTIATDGLAECGSVEFQSRPRKPEILADAAFWIITQDSTAFTGNFCIDETVLREAGTRDFEQYNVVAGTAPSDLSQDHLVAADQLARLAELRQLAE